MKRFFLASVLVCACSTGIAQPRPPINPRPPLIPTMKPIPKVDTSCSGLLPKIVSVLSYEGSANLTVSTHSVVLTELSTARVGYFKSYLLKENNTSVKAPAILIPALQYGVHLHSSYVTAKGQPFDMEMHSPVAVSLKWDDKFQTTYMEFGDVTVPLSCSDGFFQGRAQTVEPGGQPSLTSYTGSVHTFFIN